jgi:transposase
MGKIVIIPEAAEEYARHLLTQSSNLSVDLYRKAVAVNIYANTDMSANKIAKLLGTSQSTVSLDIREIIRLANKEDVEQVKGQWGGRRNSLLTVDEEKQFLAKFEAKVMRGKFISGAAIHNALCDYTDRDLPLSTTLRLLARNNWKKVFSGIPHPYGKPKAQARFREKSRWYWLPASETK